MGLYDNFVIDHNILPLTEDERLKIKKKTFQTKDFDCILGNIYVQYNGDLYLYDLFSRYIFSGFINFYALGENSEWFEFNAIYDSGELINIIRINDDI